MIAASSSPRLSARSQFSKEVNAKLLQKTVHIKDAVRKADPVTGVVRAIVSVTGNVDEVGDRIVLGAFAPFLQQARSTGVWPKVALNHMVGQGGAEPILLGRVVTAQELRPGDYQLPESLQTRGLGGLLADLKFDVDVSARARQIFGQVKSGTYDQYSFMFAREQPFGSTIVEDLRGLRVDGVRRLSPDHVQDIKAIRDVYEAGPVVFGANPATVTVGAKNPRHAQRLPTPLELAISSMAIDAGRAAAEKAWAGGIGQAVFGSWWRSRG